MKKPTWRRRWGRVRTNANGFLMLELLFVMSFVALMAMYAQKQLVNDSIDNVGKGSGTYLLTASQALQQHFILNFNAYANGLPIAGFANPAQPTLAELIAAGRLRAGFPAVMPIMQPVRFDVATANCPGPTCQVTGTVCSVGAVTWDGVVRHDLAATMVDQMNGRGALSRFGNGATLTGANWNSPNPVGVVDGVACGTAFLDTATLASYLTVNDARDPNFQNNLTVGGWIKPSAGAGQTVTAGTACAAGVPNGAMANDTSGRLLTCQANIWTAPDGAKSVIKQAPVNNVPGGTSFPVLACEPGGAPWAAYNQQSGGVNLTVTPTATQLVFSVSQVGANWVTLTQAVSPPNAPTTVNGNAAILGFIPAGTFFSGCSY